MPKTKKQFEEMRIATNEKIKNAGIKLFASKGFADTSVQDIANLAGISTGLLYRHYKSKESLFYALVTQAGTALDEIKRVFQCDESPSILLNQVTQNILEEIKNDDNFSQYFVLIEQSFKLKDKMPQIQMLIEKNIVLINQTASLIDRGQKLGQFIDGNAYEMAILYFSIIQGLVSVKSALKDEFAIPDIKMVTAFLKK
ncbi:TetR/AcrR family transcriptional regulator [Clostridium tyrobutyricum]|uniref:TetR/AcrR family transcriptional regulator n=1 Tax=Clostridium tyrobutyricum TaxID=1519 RepID=UPI001C39193F|nr:TetR/AcrR family transcriptional regulator [Clostridium tyrobutyricum]MBV4420601.1 TetR/AcrR family transcriptional regulator [Clostridium tyrobutyricum]